VLAYREATCFESLAGSFISLIAFSEIHFYGYYSKILLNAMFILN